MTTPAGTVQKHGGVWLAVAAAVGFGWFLWLINAFPNFYNDDYYIFYRISSQPASLFSTDMHERFFLFLRPVTYLYFWILYTLFGTSAVAMKLAGAAVASLMLIVLYGSLRRLQRLNGWDLSPALTAFVCLIAALHRDVAHGIVWIADMNEILAALFYVLSFYVLLHRVITVRHIILSCCWYVLAVLAKPQPLHFPLLLGLFYLVFGHRYDGQSRRSIRLLLVFSGTVFAAVMAVNGLFISSVVSDFQWTDHLWKKPFAMIGTTIYILFPLIGEEIYLFFLRYRAAAVVLLPVIVAAAAVQARTRMFFREHWKVILVIVGSVTIIFFPRMLGYGGERLNVTQLVWLPLLFMLLMRSLPGRAIIAIIAIWSVQNALSTLALIDGLHEKESRIRRHGELVQQYQERSTTPVVVVPSSAHFWNSPYMAAFNRTGTFGADPGITYLDVMAYNPFNGNFDRSIQVQRKDSLLEVSAAPGSGTYLILYHNSSLTAVRMQGDGGRGYRSITVRIPERMVTSRFIQVVGDSIIER